jgi:hypothetical protein
MVELYVEGIKKSMELRHFRSFIASAEEWHFSHAGREERKAHFSA